MNEKISFPDLVALLAAKLNVTKKEAEAFLKEFFTVSTEVISSGDELKINELGVFKSIWVEPRASVNVQTGEPVEIPGHYKLTFVPDKALREAVNAPFSSFSVEILNDHVSTEEMMPVGEEDTVGNCETGYENPSSETAVGVEPSASLRSEQNEHLSDTDTVEDKGAAEEAPNKGVGESKAESLSEIDMPGVDTETETKPDSQSAADDTLSEFESAKSRTEEGVQPIEKVPSSLQEKPAIELPEPERDEDENAYNEYLQKSASRRAFWWGAFSGLGVVVALCVAAWFFLRSESGIKIGEYTLLLTDSEVFASNATMNNLADTTVIPEVADTTVTTGITDNDREHEAIVKASRADSEKKNEKVESQTTPVKEQVAAKPVIETIRSGVFLTTLARKYFGHKTFWVYIYEENKRVIDNPNQIPIGTRVVIPDAAKYHIDAQDRHSVEEAKALAVKILSRYE